MFPQWNALHPLIVHFPIALLLVAPLLVIASLFKSKASIGLSYGALGLMLLGTIAAWVAVSTGEAAQVYVPNLPAAQQVLHEHEELAELTQGLFTVITLLYAAILLVPIFRKKETPPRLNTALTVTLLVLYLGAAGVLANTAHHGGKLVHQFGVLSPLFAGSVDE